MSARSGSRKRSAPDETSGSQKRRSRAPATASTASGNDENVKKNNGHDDNVPMSSAHHEPTESSPFEWVGEGVVNADLFDEHTRVYEAIRMRLGGQQFTLRRGDVVRLLGGNDDDEPEEIETDPATWICRVEYLFASSDNPEPQFRGRWFYGVAELQDLLDKCEAEKEENVLKSLISGLDEGKDLVLSNVEEDNSISTIQQVCSVVYLVPNSTDGNVVPGRKKEATATGNHFTCRYRLDWDDQLQTFTTHVIDLDTDTVHSSSVSSSDANSHENNVEESQDDDEDEDSMSDRFSHVIQEGEGSALRANILVGDKYQVTVGPFIPNQVVASRNPQLVWKPGCASDAALQTFADELAGFHTPFLRSHNLTSDEPYTPLRSDRAEELMKGMPGEKRLTGSSLSTASVFLGKERSNLLKECDVDSLMLILADNDYDTAEAMRAVRCNPHDITDVWSATEREIFDDSYRRHQGALRMVAKALHPTKTMKQVIDYFYRFKIPDQFRIYQDKKREQAMHLVECIDKRRRGLSITVPGNNHGGSDSDRGDDEEDATHNNRTSRWQESAVDDNIHAMNERRQTAKKLLLEVDSLLGREVLAKIAVSIQQLHTSHDKETKEVLLRELRNLPDLQRRFLEFLPRDI